MNIAEIRAQYPQYSDLSDRDLVSGLHKSYYKDIPYADFLRKIDFSERVDPSAGGSTLNIAGMDTGIRTPQGVDRVLAGAGKAAADIGLAVRQITGNASQAEVDERKVLDAPLMDTGAGMAGNLAGNVAMAVLPGLGAAGAGKNLAMPGLQAAGKYLLSSPATLGGAATQGALGGAQAALQPVATGESRATNAAIGAAGGALVPAVGMAYKGSKAAVEPLYEGGRQRIVSRALREAAGENVAPVMQRLGSAAELVPGSAPTAAEVAESGGIAALQRAASAVDPESYATRATQQNEARVAALQGLAANPAAREAAVEARDAAATPLRNIALESANTAGVKVPELEAKLAARQDGMVSALRDQGRFATMASQQENLAHNWVPVPGMPRAPGRYSQNIDRVPEALGAAADAGTIATQRRAEKGLVDYQLNSLAEHGLFPLEANTITRTIDSIASTPGLRSSDVVTKAMGALKEKISSLTNERGVIDARDLYTIRKEIGNSIANFAKETGNWDKRLTSGLERQIQLAIDDAIKGAGGSQWGDYLSKFQELSRPIQQMDVAQEITDRSINKLTGQMQPRAFAYALSDDTAAKATGFNKATLEGVMEPQQLATLRALQADLARSVAARDLGRGAGSDTVQKLAMTNLMQQSGIPVGVLNVPGVGRVGNWAYSVADDKMRQSLAQTLLNPQQTGQVMQQGAPNLKAQKLAEILRSGSSRIMVGGVPVLLDTPRER